MGRVLLAYGTPPTAVSSFCFLGETLSSADDEWPAVQQNLCGAQGNGDGWRSLWEGRDGIR